MTQSTPTGSFGLNPQDELNDLRMSDKAVALLEHVKRFCAETVAPMAEKFAKLGEGRAGRRSPALRQAGKVHWTLPVRARPP